MSQAKEPITEDILRLIDKWRHFAYYQLEPRVDVFFAPFLPDVLASYMGLDIDPRLVPQFPLKKEGSRQADRVDYFALSKDGECAFLIELKTDMGSRRSSQDQYLLNAVNKGMSFVLKDLKELAKVRNKQYRHKYFHLLHAVSELGLIELPNGLEEAVYASVSSGVNELTDKIKILKTPRVHIVYVQPTRPKTSEPEDDTVKYIDFAYFASHVESQGQLGCQLAHYLRRWTANPATLPPVKCE